MEHTAIDECIRNKRYSEAASLVVKNYKLSPQLTKHITFKLKEKDKELEYLRERAFSRIGRAQEVHQQTLEGLSREGLLVNTPETDKSLSEQLSDDEEP
jgi:predicted outer membrane protein